MQDITISLVQSDLIWENAYKNLDHFDLKLTSIKGKTDIIVFPEMFNTGFSMNPQKCAEKIDGSSMQWLRHKAKELNATIIASLVIEEQAKYFNRLIVMKIDGSFEQYNKRHLFRLSEERKLYTKGLKKIIVNVNGWKFCPLICYDLRFPVWSKNNYNEKDGYEYDCLIFLANWPQSRKHIWNSLLIARAIENQAYVVAVNRIGEDGFSTPHSGNSMIIDYKGNQICTLPENIEMIKSFTLSKEKLVQYRNQFTIGFDWDCFKIID